MPPRGKGLKFERSRGVADSRASGTSSSGGGGGVAGGVGNNSATSSGGGKGGGKGRAGTQGDWTCTFHDCDYHNFGWRDSCKVCSISRETGSAPRKGGDIPPCPTYRADSKDVRMWHCCNCQKENLGNVRCSCGHGSPGWIRRGLTSGQHGRERQREARREIDEAARRANGQGSGGDGSGSPVVAKLEAENAKWKAKNAELEARLKKELGGAKGSGAAAAEQPGGVVAAEGADAGDGSDPMEVDTHKGHQARAKLAEEQVKKWQEILDKMVEAIFPDGVEDSMDIQRHVAAGPAHLSLHEAWEELEAARSLVRSSRPMGAQIGIKRRAITTTEGKLAANEQKVRDQGAVVASLEKSLQDAKDQEAELLETVRNQHTKLAQLQEELVELRREELEGEGGAAAPPPPPHQQATGDCADAESVGLRAQMEPKFLEDFISSISNPAVLQALLEAGARKKALVDEDVAARAEAKAAQEETARSNAGLAAPTSPAPAPAAGSAVAAAAAAGLPGAPLEPLLVVGDAAAHAALAEKAVETRVRSRTRSPPSKTNKA